MRAKRAERRERRERTLWPKRERAAGAVILAAAVAADDDVAVNVGSDCDCDSDSARMVLAQHRQQPHSRPSSVWRSTSALAALLALYSGSVMLWAYQNVY